MKNESSTLRFDLWDTEADIIKKVKKKLFYSPNYTD